MFMQNPGLMLRIIHPDDRETLACFNCVENKPVDGFHVGADLRIVTRTGEMRWIAHRCQAVTSSDGRFLGRRGSNRDITERKLREEEVQKINQQLQLANAEKDMLFSIIGHDLRSPVCGFLASATMLADEFENLSPEDCRTLFAALRDSAGNAMVLLEDLLQWARMSQGRIEYAPAPFGLEDLLNQGLSTAQDMAKSKEIAVHLKTAPGLTVTVDKPMINTVIRNILFNAIKFTPRGGVIVILVHRKGQNVLMAIQDNGIGMNDRVLSSIFTLEKDKCRLGTDCEKGTCLGLMLCKQFIERHGGKIWADSKPGKGTTVFFTLPIAEAS